MNDREAIARRALFELCKFEFSNGNADALASFVRTHGATTDEERNLIADVICGAQTRGDRRQIGEGAHLAFMAEYLRRTKFKASKTDGPLWRHMTRIIKKPDGKPYADGSIRELVKRYEDGRKKPTTIKKRV